MIKVSIITVCFNSIQTIEQTIESVICQDYADIEYIIIDGGSTDGTLDVIKRYDNYVDKFISEDDKGMYDALNKGIEISNGEIIGILNSDDTYSNKTILSSVANTFNKYNVALIWGNAVFVNAKMKIRRTYSGANISPSHFSFGIMPPHPSVFIKKCCYEQYGNFDIKYKIAADYDLLLRLLILNNCSFRYCPEISVYMKIGGISNRSLKNIVKLNKEIYQIHLSNHVPISIFNLLIKVPKRLLEIIKRPF